MKSITKAIRNRLVPVYNTSVEKFIRNSDLLEPTTQKFVGILRSYVKYDLNKKLSDLVITTKENKFLDHLSQYIQLRIEYLGLIEGRKHFLKGGDPVETEKINEDIKKITGEIFKVKKEISILFKEIFKPLPKVSDLIKMEEFTQFDNEKIHKELDSKLYLIDQEYSSFTNIYSNETDKSHTVLNRIMTNINLFLNNSKKLNQYKDIEEISVLTNTLPHSYDECITQNGINNYNSIIGHINGVVNEYNQINPSNQLSLLKKLHNQIMQEEKVVRPFFESRKELVEAINDFKENKILEVFNQWIEFYDSINVDTLLGKNAVRYFLYKNHPNVMSGVDDSTLTLNQTIQELLSTKKSDDSSEISIMSIEELLPDFMVNIKNELLNNIKNFEDVDKTFICDINTSNSDIQNWMGSIVETFSLIGKFCGRDNKSESELVDCITESRNLFLNLYTKTRNFVTKKPYEIKSRKENFGVSQLLEGFSITIQNSKKSVIFVKDDEDGKREIYFGITGYQFSDETDIITTNNDETFFRKMDYYTVGSLNKSVQLLFRISDSEVRMIRNGKEREEFIKSDTIIPQHMKKILLGSINKENTIGLNSLRGEDLTKVIEYFQPLVEDYYNNNVKTFGLELPKLRPASENKTWEEWINYVENAFYVFNLNKKVSESTIIRLIDEGKLLMFKLTNKDLSEKSTGNKNLHTIYLESLFSDHNIKHKKITLLGGGEIRYRKASISNPIVHRVGDPMTFRGRKANGEIFNKEIIKDRRFTKDQFTITLIAQFNGNDQEEVSIPTFNNLVNKETKSKNYLGIDIGERNLLVATVVNNKGELLHQECLNIINKIDYNTKLNNLAADRLTSSKKWELKKSIINLKEGFVSDAIHKIVNLLLKYDAFLVLENLENMGSMRSHIDKHIYTKFIDSLFNKLEFITQKNKTPMDQGSVFNPIQLIPAKPKKADDRYKHNQLGKVLFVHPAYTSKIDFRTGFFNKIKKLTTKNFDEYIKSVKFIDNQFLITINYNNGTGDWVVTSKDDRHYWNKTAKKIMVTNPTQRLIKLMVDNNIELTNGADLTNKIAKLKSTEFLRFWTALKSILQIRQTNADKVDYIQSPIVGSGYDTRYSQQNEPTDSDLNGSYHVALKGILLHNKIKEQESRSIKTPYNYSFKSITITEDEWMCFASQTATNRTTNTENIITESSVGAV